MNDEKRELLQLQVAGLDEVDPALTESALRFLLDGTDEDVVAEICGRAGSGTALGLRYCDWQAHELDAVEAKWRQRPQDLERLGTVPADVYLRLGNLFAGCCRYDPDHVLPPWACALIWEGREYQGPLAFGNLRGYTDLETLEGALEIAGYDPSCVVRRVLVDRVPYDPMAEALADHTTLGDALVRHPTVVSDALQGDRESRRRTLDILARAQADPTPWLAELAALATSGGKDQRGRALKLMKRAGKAGRDALGTVLESGAAGARRLAVEALVKVAGKKARPLLRHHLEVEKAARVREAIDKVFPPGSPRGDQELPAREAGTASDPQAPECSVLDLPPLEADDVLPRAALGEGFWEMFQKGIRSAGELNDEAALRATFDSIGETEPWHESPAALLKPDSPWAGWDTNNGDLRAFVGHGDVGVVPVVRLLWHMGCLGSGGSFEWGLHDAESLLRFHQESRKEPYDLRSVALAFSAAALDPHLIGHELLGTDEDSRKFDWGEAEVVPYFAVHLDLLEEALDLRPPDLKWASHNRTRRQLRVFDVLERFEHLPPTMTEELWRAALGQAKRVRVKARQVLRRQRCDDRDRLYAALKDRQQGVRAAAAEWLGELGEAAAVSVLRAARDDEKQDKVRDAIDLALERLPAARSAEVENAVVLPTPDVSERCAVFRALGDGSLTDADDGSLRLADDAVVRVAHAYHLEAEEARAWSSHLAEYEVVPLFDQVNRKVYRLDEDRGRADGIGDAAGHSIADGVLRGQAKTRGYQRGRVEDGAMFHAYVKSFASVGIDVHLTFSGAELFGDTADTVGLGGLMFLRGGKRLKLREVPPVLLSECWNDLAEIAAMGSGPDPSWQAVMKE